MAWWQLGNCLMVFSGDWLPCEWVALQVSVTCAEDSYVMVLGKEKSTYNSDKKGHPHATSS